MYRSKLTTSVYRKPTHTDRYLHYSSHYYPKGKSGIADCLYHRAKWICQQGPAPADEGMHVQKVFMAIGYPKQAGVKKQRKRRDGCLSGQPRVRVFLPYIKGISQKISRARKPLDVQTVFTSKDTLRKSLMKVTRRTGTMDLKGVVVLNSLCWMHRNLCWRDREGAESLYGIAQKAKLSLTDCISKCSLIQKDILNIMLEGGGPAPTHS